MTSEYQVVFIANGQLEADMYRLTLEAADIPVLTRRESAGAVYGLTVGVLGVVEILVPINRVEEAKQLIASIEAGEINIPEDYFSDDDISGEDNFEPDQT